MKSILHGKVQVINLDIPERTLVSVKSEDPFNYQYLLKAFQTLPNQLFSFFREYKKGREEE
jgi:hypothetical protein